MSTERFFNFTVGIVFSPSLEDVMLLEKNTAHKPHMAWQHGMFNGVGGSVNPNETPEEGMIRECYEEFGVMIMNWYPLCTIIYQNGIAIENPDDRIVLHVFRTVATHEQYDSIKMMENERPVSIRFADLSKYAHKLIPNMNWMIPAAKYENDMGTLCISMPSGLNEPYLSRYVPQNL